MALSTGLNDFPARSPDLVSPEMESRERPTPRATQHSPMSEPQTLQFESARVLATLFANDLTLLKQLESLLDVRVTTREGWLRVEGEAERFEQVRRVFGQLERARQNGVSIRRHEFLYGPPIPTVDANKTSNPKKRFRLRKRPGFRFAGTLPKSSTRSAERSLAMVGNLP